MVGLSCLPPQPVKPFQFFSRTFQEGSTAVIGEDMSQNLLGTFLLSLSRGIRRGTFLKKIEAVCSVEVEGT
tara:strand:- start:1322 stop:1534 length:213 start_codon:yes stop_codon:yes gene_type:complete